MENIVKFCIWCMKVPSFHPAHPANSFFMAQFNKVFPSRRLKTCYQENYFFQVISWNREDFFRITQKQFYWIPWEILRYLEAKIVKIWCTKVILWAKSPENKYLSTWKL